MVRQEKNSFTNLVVKVWLYSSAGISISISTLDPIGVGLKQLAKVPKVSKEVFM